jgi:hypothetical protein
VAAHSNILMIGMTGYPAHDGFFLSERNIYEYETIVWNFPSFAAELAAGKTPDGVQAFFQASFRRLQTLNEWVVAGNTLVYRQWNGTIKLFMD